VRKLTAPIPEWFEISEPLRADTRDILTLPTRRVSARLAIPSAREDLSRKLEEAVRARRGPHIRVAVLPNRDD
jgi:hypothetical protein